MVPGRLSLLVGVGALAGLLLVVLLAGSGFVRSTAAGGGGPGCTTYPSTDTPMPIADVATIVSTLNVPDTFTVGDVNVLSLNITHTWDEDLDVFLISPQDTRVELFTDIGGDADDFVDTSLDDEGATSITVGSAPFTGVFRPEGRLSDLDGETSAGAWRLEVTDDAPEDVGTLSSWQLELCEAGPQPTPGVDSDSDGCTDVQESGPNPALGGQRDPTSFWDFMDVWSGGARNRIVNIGDIGAVVARFGSFREPPPTKVEALAEALTPPAAPTGYHASADRGGPIPGQDLWDQLPPNGSINVNDIGAAVVQFGHTCA